MAAHPAFPPSVVVAVKALACELPARCGRPLSRWSRRELQREVLAQGLVAEISPNRELRRHPRVDLFQEVVCESGELEARSHGLLARFDLLRRSDPLLDPLQDWIVS